MKGVVGGKRRWWWWWWRMVGVGFIVILSMLFPFFFLLSGYLSDQQPPSSPSTSAAHNDDNRITHPTPPVSDHSPPPPPPTTTTTTAAATHSTPIHVTHHPTPADHMPPPPPPRPRPPPANNATVIADGAQLNYDAKEDAVEERGRLCELRYGSYCHWRRENRQVIKDAVIKKMKDQLFVARAYYPSIAKLKNHAHLTEEIKQNIQEYERLLSESTADADLPSQIEKKMQKMQVTIAKAKACKVDCNNLDKKFRQLLDMTEDESNFHMKQSAFLYQLVVQTKPKSLHCLSMKLTVECFKLSFHDMDILVSEKVSDPTLHHHVIFSDNILASTVAINSTVAHARESRNMVFHVLTDEQNFYAMKLWFFNNSYEEATVQVLKIEDLDLSGYDKADWLREYLPTEFRVSLHGSTSSSTSILKTDYVSLFSPAHYLLPYIFPNLEKVVVLDDDVVVQQDLNSLWKLNMNGKVNGAVQLCSVQLGQLTAYLGKNNVARNSCAWMSGLNVVDLSRWRALDLTATYEKLRQEVKNRAAPVEAVAFSANLLTFDGLIYPLDSRWVLLGLGQNYRLDNQLIKEAAVLHYNGLMKPWLELGIPKYKQYWKQFLNRENQFLSECNVNA